MSRLQPRAGDFLTTQATRPGLMPELRTLYVERVETATGDVRPVWWPGFVLVLRRPTGGIERSGLPRGAREATTEEVARWHDVHGAVSPALPLEGLGPPTRVYAAPAAQAALF